MGIITLEKEKIIFQRRDELTVVEAYGKDCIRCRSTKNGKLSEESWTLLAPAEASEATVSGDSQCAVLTNGSVSVKVEAGNPWYGGVLTWYREGKQILHTKFEGDYTGRNVHTEGDHYQIKVIFDANPGEHFYGLGQEQEDIFDRKGSTRSEERRVGKECT